jgi:hypothetical protein
MYVRTQTANAVQPSEVSQQQREQVRFPDPKIGCRTQDEGFVDSEEEVEVLRVVRGRRR